MNGIKAEIEAAGNELVLLEKYTEKAQLLDAVKDADALIIRSDKVDAEVLDAARQLKIVVRAGAGYDNIDLAAATAHNVVAENTPGQNANAVAELVFGLLVMAVRGFYNGKSGSELLGKKLGILAFGNVGRNVARIAKGFGMDVYAYDAFCPAEVIEAAGVHAVANQDALFETCDVVSLHIPATPETKQSINYALVGKMKKGGILVNTARQEVINEPELLKLMAEREDLKFVTDIMPDANDEFQSSRVVTSRPRRRWVPRLPRPTSMPVSLPPSRSTPSSRTATPNSRSTNRLLLIFFKTKKSVVGEQRTDFFCNFAPLLKVYCVTQH